MPYIINCISICNIIYMWASPTKKGFVFAHFYTRIPQLHSGGTWTYGFNAHLLMRPTFLKKKLQCCLLPATLYPVDLCSLFFSFFPCSTTAQNRCMCIDFIQDSNLQICDILWHSSMIWSCYVKIAKNFQPLYTTGGFNWCDPSSEMAILKLEVLPNRTISLRSRAYIANITNTYFKMLNQLSLSNQILLNPWNKLRSALKKNI